MNDRTLLKKVRSIICYPLTQAGLMVKKIRGRRVPVVLQMSDVECGAACLAMILSYYGQKAKVADCRAACSIGRNGTNAQFIASEARKKGLQVNAYSVKNVSDFKFVQLPAIVHWKFNHFVVVERWSPNKIIIVDPAGGRRILTSDEFDEGFTGIVLTFSPGVHFRPMNDKSRSVWSKYFQSILETPKAQSLFLQIIGASLLIQVLGLAYPVFTKILVDQVVPYRINSVMNALGLGIIVLMVANIINGYLRSALLIYLQSHLDSHIMLGFFEHMLSLPFRFFQERTNGDLLMRLNSNVMIREILTNQTISSLLDGVFVLTYLLILITQNIFFGVLTLCIGLLQIGILLGTTRRIHNLTEKYLLAQASSQSYLVEALSGLSTLKVAGAEDQAIDHWSNLFYKQLNISLEQSQLTAIVGTLTTALRIFSPVFLLWIGALRVLGGTMSLGTMLALTALASSALVPIASLVNSGQQLQLVGANLERISDVMDAIPEQDSRQVQSAPRLTGRIDLEEVSFQYNPKDPFVLKNISLAIQPGQKIAVVGRSGAGKTTLGMLLLGLYEPTSGEIVFDGQPLKSLEYRSLRRQFGVVPQAPYIFGGSIRQNIAFNNPELSFEQIVEAAKLASIHQEIEQFPMGYETMVAEGGSFLSGGQRQRLALARALVTKPAVLLLDEATSDLDSVTESEVDNFLSQLSCTRIVIAHRLSTVRNSDLIIVLEDGEIVERGKHDELLFQEGVYARLVNGQLEDQQSTKYSY